MATIIVDTDGVSGDYATIREAIVSLPNPLTEDTTIHCQATTDVVEFVGGDGYISSAYPPDTGVYTLTITRDSAYRVEYVRRPPFRMSANSGTYVFDLYWVSKEISPGLHVAGYPILDVIRGSVVVSGVFLNEGDGFVINAYTEDFYEETTIRIENAILANTLVPGTSATIVGDIEGPKLEVVNCLLYNNAASTPVMIANLTRFTNCSFVDIDVVLGSSDSDYNSSDTTFDLSMTGTHNRENQTFTFFDQNNSDFRLSTSDTAARGRGIGPDLDSLVPTTDVEGVTRYGTLCNIGPYETTAPNRPVTGVTITGATQVDEESTIALVATIAPYDALDTGVYWESLNPAIASVDQSGVVTGITPGNATIKVTTDDGGYTDTHPVEVLAIVRPVTGVTIVGPNVGFVGEDTQLYSQTAPSNATDQSVTWSSLTPLIATVSLTGLVTILDTGTATIQVLTTDGGFTDTQNIECLVEPGNQEEIWANNSPGEVVDPGASKFGTGFVSEKWPLEWANFMFNHLDRSLTALESYGMFTWDTLSEYLPNAIVLHNGKVWKCLSANGSTGVEPGSLNGWSEWTLDDGAVIGDICMFSGAWVDNFTMPGWYACVDGNQAFGCPNMEDLFVTGKLSTGPGSKVGSNLNTMPLSALPSHTHTVESTVFIPSGGHTHSYSRINRMQMGDASTAGIQPIPLTGWSNYSTQSQTTSYQPTIYVTLYQDEETTGSTGVHSHGISGSLAFGGSQGQFSFVPEYAELIFVRKCR